jgi:hypothetical protein
VEKAAAPAPVAFPKFPELGGLLMKFEGFRNIVWNLRFESANVWGTGSTMVMLGDAACSPHGFH